MLDTASHDHSELARELCKENHIRRGIEVHCEMLQYKLKHAQAERDWLRRENESLRARLASMGRIACIEQDYRAILTDMGLGVSRTGGDISCLEHRAYLKGSQCCNASFSEAGAEMPSQSDSVKVLPNRVSLNSLQHVTALKIGAWRRFALGMTFRRKAVNLLRAYSRELKEQAQLFFYASWRRFILAKSSRQKAHDLLKSYCVELKDEVRKGNQLVRKSCVGRISQALLVRKYDNLKEEYQKLCQQWKQLRSCSTQATLTDSGTEEFDIPPYRWGIRMQQLVDLHDGVYDDFQQYCSCHSMYRRGRDRVHVCHEWPCRYGDHEGVEHQPMCHVPEAVMGSVQPMKPDMHVLVDRYVKPKTKKSKRSYALTVNPRGAEVSVFVTHSWNDLFENFVSTLRWAVPAEEVLWVCSFAINQHSSSEVQHMLSTQDLDQVPFAQALKFSVKQLVVVDEELSFVSRAWCLFEVARAFAWGIPTHLRSRRRSTLLELSSKIRDVDITKAHATEQDDLTRIFATIQETGGFDALNEHIRRCIRDKVEVILEQGDGSLWSSDLRKVDVLCESLQRTTDEAERDKLRMLIRDVESYALLDDDKVARLLNEKVRDQTDKEFQDIVSQLRDVEMKKASTTDQELLVQLEKEQNEIEFAMRNLEMRKLANVKERFLLSRVEEMATKVNEMVGLSWLADEVSKRVEKTFMQATCRIADEVDQRIKQRSIEAEPT